MRSGGCADDEPWRPLIAGNFRAFMAAKNGPQYREGEGVSRARRASLDEAMPVTGALASGPRERRV